MYLFNPTPGGPLNPSLFSATITQQTALGTPELTLISYTGVTHYFAHSNNSELYLVNTQAGLNTLVLRNTSTSGYAALVTDQQDYQFPSTAQNAAGYYQHATFGYGYGLASNGRIGYGFIESARFDGAFNAAIWPLQFNIQQTGGAMLAPTFVNVVTTVGLPTITLNGGGSFAGGINGMAIRESGDGGFFTPGTTIVSGQGTATLTLSTNALASNGFVPVLYGTLTYGQYNAMIFRDLTSIDWYTWANAATSSAPYMRFDRNNGRLGVGAYANSLYPVASLDVIGNAIFGTDTSARTAAFASYPINIATSATTMQKWLKVGTNTALWLWPASPNGIQLFDGNASREVFTGYMDGTSRLKTNGGRILAQRVVTAAGAITAATTDDVIVVNKTVGAATAVNLFATPTAGTRLTIKDGKGDALANNITITPAAGTIDGAATLVILVNYGYATIEYNGTEWGRIA